MPLKIGIIIQCRMDSKRLPGKSLMRIGDKSLIEHTYYNAIKSKLAHDCIVAIPNTPDNEVLAMYLKNNSIPFISGSENNLVSRHLLVSEAKNFDLIVRIPGDNPLPHQSEVDRIIAHHCTQNAQGFSTNLSEVFNSGYPDGIGAELFSHEILNEVNQSLATAQELEHVHLNFFNYATQKPTNDEIKVSTIKCPNDFARPDIRLDINNKLDLEYFRDMFSHFENSEFNINDILQWHDSLDKSKYEHRIG